MNSCHVRILECTRWGTENSLSKKVKFFGAVCKVSTTEKEETGFTVLTGLFGGRKKETRRKLRKCTEAGSTCEYSFYFIPVGFHNVMPV